nr:VanZ family protein [Inediibacterium massiliense]
MKTKKQIGMMILWILVIFWMAVIFNLSSQVSHESNKLSKEVTKVIVKTVEKVAPKTDFNMSKLNHIVRKNAHFFAYLILGILVINALRSSGYRKFGWALLICVVYAISDEVHQMFVPGRGPGIKDVCIDSAGATVGIGIALLLINILNRFKRGCWHE